MFVISTDLVLNFVDKLVVEVDAAADDADDDGGGDVECRDDDDDDDDDSGGGILVDDCIDGESCCKTLVPDEDVIGVEGDFIGGFDDNMKWVDDDGDDDDDGGDDVFKVETTDDGDSGATSNLDVGRILSEIAWSIILLSK